MTVGCSKKVVVVGRVEITLSALKVTVVGEDDFVFSSPWLLSSNEGRSLEDSDWIDYRVNCMKTGCLANPFVGFVVVLKKESKLMFLTFESDWIAIDIVGLENVDNQSGDLLIQTRILFEYVLDLEP